MELPDTLKMELCNSLASAWNEIVDARSKMPLPEHKRTTKILQELDRLMAEFQPAGTCPTVLMRVPRCFNPECLRG